MNTSSENNLSPTRIAMNVGAVGAGLALLVSAFGWQTMSWIVFVCGIYFGMKRFRRELGGFIIYIKALSAGFQTAFFMSFILAFFTYISVYMEPKLVETTLNAMEQQLKTYGIPSMMTDSIVAQWRNILSPVVIGALTMLSYCFIGGLLSVFCAFFVKNVKPAESI